MPKSTITMRLKGTKRMIQGLSRLSTKGMKAACTNSTKRIGQQVRLVLMKYPPQRNRKRQSVFATGKATEKQRAWFFASLREGSITVPYQRTGLLGSNWKSKTIPFRTTISNNVKYGPWVQSPEHQIDMHRVSKWATTKKAKNHVRYTGKEKKIMKDEINTQLAVSGLHWRI